LEVGTGSGYLTACLSLLGAEVISLEIDPVLAAAARARRASLGLERIAIREADALAGPTAGGPFAAIAVTGSVPRTAILRVLEDQLAAGGRLFCILGDPPAGSRVETVVPAAHQRLAAEFEEDSAVLH
jgi:protein-L-isoaspartate(D-aspartate) O-methyltransferase